MAECASRTKLSRPNSASSPPNCAICLGPLINKSVSDTCNHYFCFSCLVEWSKIKAECPLCKQRFTVIKHSYKANGECNTFVVKPVDDIISLSEANVINEIIHDEEFLYIPTPSQTRAEFTFRTTLTVDSRGERAIQHMIFGHPIRNAVQLTDYVPRYRRRDFSATSFRRSIYNDNLWAHAPPDVTGRYREVSPEFYRENPAARTRLAPWLNRELNALLYENTQQVMALVDTIMENLLRYHICSRSFRAVLNQHLGNKTDHFIHEFYNFMRSPFDMIGYDRLVRYTERPISPIPSLDSFSPIPSINISDDENNSDVVFVEERNPGTVTEIIDLVESDSDEPVIVSEEPPPNIRDNENLERCEARQPLKMRMKRKRMNSDEFINPRSSHLKCNHNRCTALDRLDRVLQKRRSSSSSSSTSSSSSDSSSSEDNLAYLKRRLRKKIRKSKCPKLSESRRNPYSRRSSSSSSTSYSLGTPKHNKKHKVYSSSDENSDHIVNFNKKKSSKLKTKQQLRASRLKTRSPSPKPSSSRNTYEVSNRPSTYEESNTPPLESLRTSREDLDSTPLNLCVRNSSIKGNVICKSEEKIVTAHLSDRSYCHSHDHSAHSSDRSVCSPDHSVRLSDQSARSSDWARSADLSHRSAHSSDHSAHSSDRTAHLSDRSAHSPDHSAHSYDRSAHSSDRSAHSSDRSAHSSDHSAHLSGHSTRSSDHSSRLSKPLSALTDSDEDSKYHLKNLVKSEIHEVWPENGCSQDVAGPSNDGGEGSQSDFKKIILKMWDMKRENWCRIYSGSDTDD